LATARCLCIPWQTSCACECVCSQQPGGRRRFAVGRGSWLTRLTAHPPARMAL
jgi:hypothetical protein